MDGLEKIVKLYKKTGYFERYGGSIFSTIFLALFFYFFISFFYTISNISKVTDNWEDHRCKYHILPFAGFLKKPKNSSVTDYTNDNLGYCLNKSMDNVSDSLMTPVYFFTMVVFVVVKSISAIYTFIYQEIVQLLVFLNMILKTLRGYVINIVLQFQKTILVLRDSIKKTFGFFSGIVMFLISVLLMLVGLISLAYHTGIALVTIVTVTLIALELLIPIAGEVMAAVTLAFGVRERIKLKPFAGLLDCLVQTPLGCNHNPPIKSIPPISQCKQPPCSCFHENTQIKLQNNTSKQISEIKIGDILHDNSIVNGIIKTKNINEDFYKIGNVLVTSNHYILYENKWILVKQYPSAIKSIQNPEFVYCLSTNTNIIPIDNHIFHDWNDDHIINNQLKTNNIHLSTNLLSENTKINNILVKDIKINDSLPNNNIVYGIVKIKNNNNLYKINDISVNKYQKIFYNNTWINIDVHPNSILSNDKPDYLIGLITKNKVLEFDNIILQDEYFI